MFQTTMTFYQNVILLTIFLMGTKIFFKVFLLPEHEKLSVSLEFEHKYQSSVEYETLAKFKNLNQVLGKIRCAFN